MRNRRFIAPRLSLAFALVAVGGGSGVAWADPSELESEMSLEERLTDAREAVEGELGGATPEVASGRPVTASLDALGRLVVGQADEARTDAVYDLPGGQARLTRIGRGGFRLLMPSAGTPAGVAAGTEPIIRYITLFAGAGGPDRLNLSMDESWADRFVNVELIRLPPEMVTDPSELIRFRVTSTPETDQGTATGERIEIEHSAESFATLRRRHRGEFDQWIAPLMEKLGLEQALLDEIRGAASSAFLEELPADASTAAAVREAVDGLASPDFATRLGAERALDELELPGAAEAARLLAADEGLSAEQEAGLTAAVGRWALLPPEEVERLLSDPNFLRDVQRLDGGAFDDVLRDAAQRRAGSGPATRP